MLLCPQPTVPTTQFLGIPPLMDSTEDFSSEVEVCFQKVRIDFAVSTNRLSFHNQPSLTSLTARTTSPIEERKENQTAMPRNHVGPRNRTATIVQAEEVPVDKETISKMVDQKVMMIDDRGKGKRIMDRRQRRNEVELRGQLQKIVQERDRRERNGGKTRVKNQKRKEKRHLRKI